jgi:hypothetical protein
MPLAQTVAAGRFDRYIAARRHWTAPGPGGVGRLIDREGSRGLCAVEQVPPPGADTLEPIRTAFAAAAGSLAGLERPGLPLIAVLADERGGGALLNDWNVRLALLGDASHPAADAPGREFVHVSGVAVVHESTHAADFRDQYEALYEGDERGFEEAMAEAEAEGRIPAGAYQWVEVFELHALTGAPPIPRELFAGQRDQWFGSTNAGSYGFVAAGAPAGLAQAAGGETQSGMVASPP